MRVTILRGASPTLDDRDWKAVNLTKPLADYGVAPNIQYCWLRLHIAVPQGQYPPIMFSAEDLIGSFQVYANGKLIGGAGDMAKHVWSRHGEDTYSLDLPTNIKSHPSVVLVAVRFAIVKAVLGAKPPQNPVPGGALLLESRRDSAYGAAAWHLQLSARYNLEVIPSTLIGLIALGLFLYIPKHPEFGWLALDYLAPACQNLVLFRDSTIGSNVGTIALFALFSILNAVGTLMFTWSLLRLRRLWVVLLLLTPLLIYSANNVCWAFGLNFSQSLRLSNLVMLSDLWSPIVELLVLWAALRGRHDAIILAPGNIAFLFSFILAYSIRYDWIHWKPALNLAYFDFTYGALASLLDKLCVIVFLVVRMIQSARQSDRTTAELAAAQTVQQLLLVNDKEHLPGFAVDTAYLPANEVGGDFFLVSAGPDGSLTALVGDVAGKGLQAAMRVSMIVGALRREASREPATILNNLNLVLLAERQSGFTTACCVHLLTDGTLTVANAGHLSPVLIGGEGARELDTAPALPLGLAEDTVSQTTGCLQHGERLMLCSDGVPEARNRKTRELMGFGRMLELAGESADSIANAAKAFGQEDDITVLTIALR